MTTLADDGFEQLLRKVMFLAFEAGKDSLQSHGFRMPDITHDERAYRRFIRACHQGYDKAQDLIGTSVADYELVVRSIEAEVKEARARRDVRAAQNLVSRAAMLGSRQLILRRVLDAILYLALMPEEWILRHVASEADIRRIDPIVVRRTLEVARQMNGQSRYQFHVVTDITTSVQLGDLIVIDKTPPGPRKWKVIELKHGAVNQVLGGIVDQSKHEAPFSAENQVRTTFGEKGVNQLRRMMRQQRRLQELERLHATDKGEDPLYKIEMRVTPDTVTLKDYLGVLGQLVKTAAAAGVAGESIDGCLHLCAVASHVVESGKARGVAAHAFYHAVVPSATCLIADSERRPQELSAVREVEPIIDIVRYSMTVPWAMPVFLWPLGFEGIYQHLVDLALGRIRVFAYFDMDGFFRLAQSAGISCSFITGKDAEEIKKFSRRFPGHPNAWGVRAALPDGSTQDLLAGFFGRLFGHYATPRQLIEMIQRMPEQEAKMR
jgi:hypothetical protein